MWEAFEHAALLRARQPDRDHRRQPARPARRDDARLGPRLVRRPGARLRLARDRDRRPRRRGDRPRPTPRRSRPTGQPTVIVAQDDQGQGRRRRSRTSTAGTASRSTTRRRRSRSSAACATSWSTCAKPEPRRAAPLRDDGALRAADATSVGEEVATRKAYGDALAALGSARGDVVALDGEVGNSTYAEIFARGAPGPLLRDVHRRAADGRGRGRAAGARLDAVRLDLRRVLLARLRLHPHGGDQPGEHPALRLARRRLDRRGRAVADGARGPRDDARRPRLDRALPVRRRTRRRSSSRRWPTARGSSSCARRARRRRSSTAPDEEFPIGGSRVAASTATTSRSSAPGSRCTRR